MVCGADSTTDEGRAAAVKVLDGLAEKYPRSLAIRRIALELVSGASSRHQPLTAFLTACSLGEEFRTKASKYITNALAKGIPSIFADIKALYGDESKRAIIGELAETYLQSLEATAKFGLPVEGESDGLSLSRHPPPPVARDPNSSSSSSETVESSAAYLWTLYFLAQHQSALSEHAHALTLITRAIAHTPSLPELWMLKARILKRAGDAVGALQAMGEAQLLDGQDRFLNSKNAKYLLRADQIEEAEKVVGLFTKVRCLLGRPQRTWR